jgi:NAD(P)-dependent dehydrogenase (short-subunit alcohol dehydrogenase family)
MLAGRVILVTGSAAGIGFASARLCHQRGATVVLHGRDGAQLRASAARLGAKADHLVGDLLDPATPARLIDAVVQRHGRLDGLVNNAALLDRCSIETLTDDLFDRLTAVNLRAPLMLIQAALPHMKARSGGASIVNIGSVNALCGAPNLLVYSATKAALATATRNLGAALGESGVRVNQLNVGWTVTESELRIQRAEGQPPDWQDRLPASLKPSGALLNPEQIAEHVAFWLSDQSAPITGQVYEVEQYPVMGRVQVNASHEDNDAKD